MADDYIPSNDAELIAFAKNFKNKTSGTPALYNLTAAANTDLDDLINEFETDVNDHLAQQITARASREKKDTTKKLLSGMLRSQAQTAQKSGISNEQRADLGLTVIDSVKTPVGAPQTRPVAEVDTSQPLRHLITFFDNESESRGKPAGVRGAQVWVKIGGEPTMNESEYKYLATDTASPYLAVHKSEDVGKQAHYLLRWENSKGEPGAWSTIVSATITG